jgi:hypothetical protein
MEKRLFEVGQNVECINSSPLPGNEEGPNLKVGEIYLIKEIVLDSAENQHLDVGLPSHLNYITSYETKEELPRGKEIHWCHPSRFELKP